MSVFLIRVDPDDALMNINHIIATALGLVLQGKAVNRVRFISMSIQSHYTVLHIFMYKGPSMSV